MTERPSNIPVWDDYQWRGFPALSGDVDADYCVVGLGGSGLAAVHELLDAGARVAGIDAGMVGGGAAGRNGGFLMAGLSAFHHEAIRRHGSSRARRLYLLTLEQIDHMISETPDAIRRTGSLRIAYAAEEEGDCTAHLEALQSDGFPAEPYDGPEGRGLLLSSDAAFQPLHRCRILAARAAERGARLFEHTAAMTISGSEVVTERGRVRCAASVVAVDGTLDRVLPELAPRVRSARLQMLATGPARDVHFPRPVYTRWGYDYWQQLPDGRLVLGGFRDLAEDDEWAADAAPSTAIQSALEGFLRERVGTSAPITHRWAALVSYSSSGLPVLEEVRPRTFVTGAYSGTGNVVGALCGRAAAQLALCGKSAIANAFDE